MKSTLLRIKYSVAIAAVACGLFVTVPNKADAGIIPGSGVYGSAYFLYEENGNVYDCELAFCYNGCSYNCTYTGMVAI